MKKILYLMLIPLCVGMIISCGKDDGVNNSDNPNSREPGGEMSGFYVSERNYNSIKITVSVNDMVRMYLEGLGVKDISTDEYANYGLNKSTLKSSMQQLFYLELSNSNQSEDYYFKRSNGNIVGEKIEYTFENLKPNTSYSYIVYQMSSTGQFVKHDAVPVETKDIETKSGDLSYSKITIYYDGTFEVYVDGKLYAEADKNYKWTSSFTNSVTIKGLSPGTSYRYHINIDGLNSKDVSFTTKSLDLSSTTVEANENTIYDAAIHGTWDFVITSDLGSKLPSSKVRFGVAPAVISEYYNKKQVWTYEYINADELYTTDTKSPYRVAYPWRIEGHTAMGTQYMLELEWMYSIIASGTADQIDKDRYDELLSKVQEEAYVRPISAFVEIDGERVFIGNDYDELY